MANFKVWAENSDNLANITTQESEQTDGVLRVEEGLIQGDSVKSDEINSILRQNSLMTTALAEIFLPDKNISYNDTLENIKNLLAERLGKQIVVGKGAPGNSGLEYIDLHPIKGLIYIDEGDEEVEQPNKIGYVYTGTEWKRWLYYDIETEIITENKSFNIDFINDFGYQIFLFGGGGGGNSILIEDVADDVYIGSGGGGGYYKNKIIMTKDIIKQNNDLLIPTSIQVTIGAGGKVNSSGGPSAIKVISNNKELSQFSCVANGGDCGSIQNGGGNGGSGGGSNGGYFYISTGRYGEEDASVLDYKPSLNGGKGETFGGGGGGGIGSASRLFSDGTSFNGAGGLGGPLGGGGGGGGGIGQESENISGGNASEISEEIFHQYFLDLKDYEQEKLLKLKRSGGKGGIINYETWREETPSSSIKAEKGYPQEPQKNLALAQHSILLNNITPDSNIQGGEGGWSEGIEGGGGGGGGMGIGGSGGNGGGIIKGSIHANIHGERLIANGGGGGGGGFFATGGNGDKGKIDDWVTGLGSHYTTVEFSGGGGGGGGYGAKGGSAILSNGGGGGGYGVAGNGGSANETAGYAGGGGGTAKGGSGICIIQTIKQKIVLQELMI